MPHCDISLYNNVIYAHRSRDLISHIIIFGNDLVKFYVNPKYEHELSAVVAYRDACVSVPLPNYEGSLFAFNDTALHFVNKKFPNFVECEPHYEFYSAPKV